MKRWHWMSLALLGGIVAVALIAVPRFSGGTSPRVAAQEAPTIQLDMDPTNGTGPCDINHIDASRTTTPGATYQVAVCLVDDGVGAPAAINFDLSYNNSLNQCVPASASALLPPGLDANPDMNAGATTFSSPDLGTGWDCTSGGQTPPSCDANPTAPAGVHHITVGCINAAGTKTLPHGIGVSSPIAEITFHAIGSGTDTLTWGPVHLVTANQANIVKCPQGPGTCVNGTDDKSGPTATVAPPTDTPTPTLTPTPDCDIVAGAPTCTPTPKAHTPTPTITTTATATTAAAAPPAPPPPAPPSGGAGANVRPPNTGDGSSGRPFGLTIAWLIAGAMATTLVGGTYYLRRVRMRR